MSYAPSAAPIRRLAAAGRQDAGAPTRGFAATAANTLSGSHAPAWEQVRALRVHCLSRTRSARTAFPRWSVGTRSHASPQSHARPRRTGVERSQGTRRQPLVPTLRVGMHPGRSASRHHQPLRIRRQLCAFATADGSQSIRLIGEDEATAMLESHRRLDQNSCHGSVGRPSGRPRRPRSA